MVNLAGAWYGVLAVVSHLAVVTNALLIAITSNFVSFEVYTRGGYADHYNHTGLVPNDGTADQGLSGYVNWSTTSFDILDLFDGDAFPAYSAQKLKSVNEDGSDVTILSGGEEALYLPFIDFDCLDANAASMECLSYNTTAFIYTRLDGSVGTNVSFSAKQYKEFYSSSKCRKLVVNKKVGDSPEEGDHGICFNNGSSCRYMYMCI